MNAFNTSLTEVLRRNSAIYTPVVARNLNDPNVLVLDLSACNTDLKGIDIQDTAAFKAYVWKEMKKIGALVAVGGYNENRMIYSRSEHFSGNESRTVHLGIDIWTEAGTPVFSPLTGIVHSFQNNVGFGNYGPTIIIKHTLDNCDFYTLYGHLSATSILHCQKGKVITAGEQVGTIGDYPENGDWPPHLHFQIIGDMGNWSGDFPGVAAPSERSFYLQLCPDPNLILQIKSLQK